MLNILPRLDEKIRLLRLQIRFLAKLGRRLGVSFHRQVVEDQSIDVTRPTVSAATRCAMQIQCARDRTEGRAIRVNKLLQVSLHGIFREIPIDMQSSFCRGRVSCAWWSRRGSRMGEGEQPYLLGALTSAARFSNACWRGVAVDGEEFCSQARAVSIDGHRGRGSVPSPSPQSASTRAGTYHPVVTLAKLGKDGLLECRVRVEAAEFEGCAPVGHVPG